MTVMQDGSVVQGPSGGAPAADLRPRRAARLIMRHDSRRDADGGQGGAFGEMARFGGRTDTPPSPSAASGDDDNTTGGDSKDLDYELYHAFDAGGNCPLVPLIEYPSRYQDRAVMKCLDDSTEHLIDYCHSEGPTAGENHVMYAYPSKVNRSDLVQRFAKVYMPIDGDVNKPGEGWPVMILFHATIPLNTADNSQADDAKAPEAHFDGIIHNTELTELITQLVTVVPAGYERYRWDGPPCPVEKYTSEFNYLPNSLGRTRHSNADDVRFVSMILDWLHGAHEVDLARVFITGHASGAHMVFHMLTSYIQGNDEQGLEFSVAGASASAGSFLTCLNDPRVALGSNGDWNDLKPMPFMYFQGLQDISSWCSGGGFFRHQGEHMYTLEQMAHAVAQRNQCMQSASGGYWVKHWVLSSSSDADLVVRAHLWEFQGCQAPVLIYTFPTMDHVLSALNTFMFKQKIKFFLGSWNAPAGGNYTLLDTRNGTTFCGCCNEATGTCDYTNQCNGQQYLATVSCPGVSDVKSRCWHSTDLLDNPVCWWITDEGNDQDQR